MIRGRSLQLRALEKNDLAFLHKLHNNQRTMSYFFEEPFETKRELEDLYEKYVHNTTERRFVIETKDDGDALGLVSLIEIDEINRRCEIDIMIDDKNQGKGYGKAGFVLGVKYAFDILNLTKVYLLVLESNFPAKKIYTYCGFKRECRLKKEYYLNGKYVDVERMCMFSTQWKRAKKRLQNDIGFDQANDVATPGDVSAPVLMPTGT